MAMESSSSSPGDPGWMAHSRTRKGESSLSLWSQNEEWTETETRQAESAWSENEDWTTNLETKLAESPWSTIEDDSLPSTSQLYAKQHVEEEIRIHGVNHTVVMKMKPRPLCDLLEVIELQTGVFVRQSSRKRSVVLVDNQPVTIPLESCHLLGKDITVIGFSILNVKPKCEKFERKIMKHVAAPIQPTEVVTPANVFQQLKNDFFVKSLQCLYGFERVQLEHASSFTSTCDENISGDRSNPVFRVYLMKWPNCENLESWEEMRKHLAHAFAHADGLEHNNLEHDAEFKKRLDQGETVMQLAMKVRVSYLFRLEIEEMMSRLVGTQAVTVPMPGEEFIRIIQYYGGLPGLRLEWEGLLEQFVLLHKDLKGGGTLTSSQLQVAYNLCYARLVKHDRYLMLMHSPDYKRLVGRAHEVVKLVRLSVRDEEEEVMFRSWVALAYINGVQRLIHQR